MPDDFPGRPAERATSRHSSKKARDTHVRGSIKQHVRLALWAKSAGRCTLCNRSVLNGAKTYLHAIPAGELAHILGAKTTVGSPRGREELNRDVDLESEDNLLLCCHDCHRMIDDGDHVAFFAPAMLRELKRAHEDRVELATSDGILTRTAVIRVGSDVRGSYTVASRREVADTLFANSYLGMVESRRSGQFECELPGEATDASYWDMARSQIGKTIGQVAQAVAVGEVEHVSVFAIAPIPALVVLGESLDDKVESRLWQKHRDVGWSWPGTNTDPAVTFSFTANPGDTDSPDVVLVCSLSAEVDPARLPEHLRGVPRLTLHPDGVSPTPMLLTTEKSLKNFATAFRDMAAAAEQMFPGTKRWHLVAATPVSASIEAGRAFMREVQPPVDVYQRTADGDYTFALTINDNSGGTPTATDRNGGRP